MSLLIIRVGDSTDRGGKVLQVRQCARSVVVALSAFTILLSVPKKN